MPARRGGGSGSAFMLPSSIAGGPAGASEKAVDSAPAGVPRSNENESQSNRSKEGAAPGGDGVPGSRGRALPPLLPGRGPALHGAAPAHPRGGVPQRRAFRRGGAVRPHPPPARGGEPRHAVPDARPPRARGGAAAHRHRRRPRPLRVRRHRAPRAPRVHPVRPRGRDPRARSRGTDRRAALGPRVLGRSSRDAGVRGVRTMPGRGDARSACRTPGRAPPGTASPAGTTSWRTTR